MTLHGILLDVWEAILDSYVDDINRIYAEVGRGNFLMFYISYYHKYVELKVLFKIIKTLIKFIEGELDKLQVPVGDDQLTRVRLEGRKSVRKGAYTAVKWIDQLNPLIIELYCTLFQDVFIVKLNDILL